MRPPRHQPASAKAFLSAVVTRISIDVLRSARVRGEEYAGQWFLEPLLTDPYEDPERSAELADSVSMAAPDRDTGCRRGGYE
jgi:RNA polymerase sigma-70 factor, ECF subfamily